MKENMWTYGVCATIVAIYAFGIGQRLTGSGFEFLLGGSGEPLVLNEAFGALSFLVAFVAGMIALCFFITEVHFDYIMKEEL